MTSIMEVLSPLPPSPPRTSPPAATSPSFWFRSPQASPTRPPQRSAPFVPPAPVPTPPVITSDISAQESNQPNNGPADDVDRSRPSPGDPQEDGREGANKERPRASSSSESGNVDPALGASSSLQAYLNTIPPIWREVPPTPPTSSHNSTSTSAASPGARRRARASAAFEPSSLYHHNSRHSSSDDSTASQPANAILNGQDGDEDEEQSGEMGPGTLKKKDSRRRMSYPALGTSPGPPDVPPLPGLLTHTRPDVVNDSPQGPRSKVSKPRHSPDPALDLAVESAKAEKRLFHIVGDEVGSDDEDHPETEPSARVNDEETDRREKMKLIRRYHALTELLTTEVGYLVDLRALVNVSSCVPSLIANSPGCLVRVS